MGKVKALWEAKIEEIEERYLSGELAYDQAYFRLKAYLPRCAVEEGMDALRKIKEEKDGG